MQQLIRMPVATSRVVDELNERSRQIFKLIVDAYVETGDPIGSRTLSRRLETKLSPATIRNVMADLEDAGLLYAPHTSAGRLPTEMGLRMFVDGLLEVGELTEEERRSIDTQCDPRHHGLDTLLEEATSALAGLSQCAGLVLAPKSESPLKHIEFVNLAPGRALVVLVSEDGIVENRIIEVPAGLPPAALIQASNYLNARIVGRTIEEACRRVQEELEQERSELNELTKKVVAAGLATWAGGMEGGSLIVRGQSHLLDEVTALEDLDRIRDLFQKLETKETMIKLLDLSNRAEGVQIFIGADNQLFGVTGCSMIVAPFRGSRQRIIGAVGVIGPTRINYARIIPMVDYTSKLISRLMG